MPGSGSAKILGHKAPTVINNMKEKTAAMHVNCSDSCNPEKETNTLVTLPHGPSEALRLTLMKLKFSSRQDTLVKQALFIKWEYTYSVRLYEPYCVDQ